MRATRNSSGAKNGTPVNVSFSPSLKLSPIWMLPWLGTPMMSPGYASSTISRSADMNVTALLAATSRLMRRCFIFIPR